jgi:hypothetical protein
MPKKPITISNWFLTDTGIYLLIGEGYRITYNPSTLYTFNLKKIKDPLFQFEEDEETEETALYINATDSYLILDGDFRNEYEVCTTLKQCKAVFKKYAPRYRSKYCSGIDSI